ncbi:MAG: hypothetical protein KDB27_06975 [Planctomycetales bacterium]|nr:hypothetical protein [Planctomycetales bacterium]
MSKLQSCFLRSILGRLRMAAVIVACLSSVAFAESDAVIVVVGAPGSDEYEQQFSEWAKRWQDISEQAKIDCTVIGLNEPAEGDATDEASSTPSRDQLKAAIQKQAVRESGNMWLVLIGHGTPHGRDAKFNLRGPDVSSNELAEWLKDVKCRVAIANCTSASGPFLNALSRNDRVVVTATKSGAEINYARFGDYFSQAIASPNSDLDHDQQVSLLEAFLTASKDVQDFYELESRLATEHALLDDNGDQKGTPASFFRGILATKSATSGEELDGTIAHQMIFLKNDRESQLSPDQTAKRDRLEKEIAALRKRKSQLADDEYYKQLENIMTQMAEIYVQ